MGNERLPEKHWISILIECSEPKYQWVWLASLFNRMHRNQPSWKSHFSARKSMRQTILSWVSLVKSIKNKYRFIETFHFRHWLWNLYFDLHLLHWKIRRVFQGQDCLRMDSLQTAHTWPGHSSTTSEHSTVAGRWFEANCCNRPEQLLTNTKPFQAF